MSLEGPYYNPPSGKVDSVVLFLHGYGADGNDLIGLSLEFTKVLPNTAFFAPHAPFVCDVNQAGRQWFPIYEASEEQRLQGLLQSAAILGEVLAEIKRENNVPLSKVVLLGFSQGTMLALHVALRLHEAVAGVVGFSGMVLLADKLHEEIKQRPPVLLVHGEADPVVPFGALAAAEQVLQQNQVPVSTLARPGLAHGIDDAGVQAAQNFLKKTLLH